MFKVPTVDDDFMMADSLEEILIDADYIVCGIAGSVAEAIELGQQHKPDLGVIDIRLSNGDYGTEVAAALRRHGRFGVLYATGNPDHPLLSEAEGEGCITKPYLAISIVSALHVVSEKIAGLPVATATLKGFRLLEA